MKIIILIDTFLPYYGGGQIFVWEVTKRLAAEHSIKIEIVTRQVLVEGKVLGNEEFFEGRLKIKRLGWPAKWDNIISRLWFIIQAAFYICRQDFDLIDAQAFVSAIPGKLAAILKGKPVILTIHGTTMETGDASWLEKIILTKIKYDAQISAAANFLKFDNINKDIKVINPGVDVNFYKPHVSMKQNNRILFVGRLQKVKGTEVLLQCMKALEEKTCKLIIVGDGVERTRMENFVKEEKISNVEFKGELAPEAVRRQYQKAAVFILPSVSEGFPLTVLEAMACGAPVCAFNVGDVSKIVENGVNGFIVKPNETKTFVEKIKLILQKKDLAAEIAKNNAAKVKNYSWEKTADKIYKTYGNVILKKI